MRIMVTMYYGNKDLEMSNKAKENEIDFEQAVSELQKINDELEQGSVPLQKAVEAFERGEKLKNIAETKLQFAQLKMYTGQDDDEIQKIKDSLMKHLIFLHKNLIQACEKKDIIMAQKVLKEINDEILNEVSRVCNEGG